MHFSHRCANFLTPLEKNVFGCDIHRGALKQNGDFYIGVSTVCKWVGVFENGEHKILVEECSTKDFCLKVFSIIMHAFTQLLQFSEIKDSDFTASTIQPWCCSIWLSCIWTPDWNLEDKDLWMMMRSKRLYTSGWTTGSSILATKILYLMLLYSANRWRCCHLVCILHSDRHTKPSSRHNQNICQEF